MNAESSTVLVVDVANLVGTTPDGWWRDRAGATRRTLRWLADLTGESLGESRIGQVVVVVEGASRRVEGPAGLIVLRARRGESGDDVITAYCGDQGAERADRTDQLIVVTADRGLRARLPESVTVAGPRAVLDLADRLGLRRTPDREERD